MLTLAHLQAQATVLESTVKGFRGVVANEGWMGLWRGFPLFTVGGLPSHGAYFYGYQWAHHRLAHSSWTRNWPLWMQDGAAGFFADVVATPLWTPTEVISTRMQIQGPGVVQYDSTAHAVRHILQHEGVPGLFRGMSASILAFGPASALWWALYQSTHRRLTAFVAPEASAPASGQSPSTAEVALAPEDAGRWSVWIDAVSGLVSGSVTSVVTNPLEIGKTRLQAQHALLAEYELVDTRAPHSAAQKGVAGDGKGHRPSLPAQERPGAEQDRRATSAKFRALEMKRREEVKATQGAAGMGSGSSVTSLSAPPANVPAEAREAYIDKALREKAARSKLKGSVVEANTGRAEGMGQMQTPPHVQASSSPVTVSGSLRDSASVLRSGAGKAAEPRTSAALAPSSQSAVQAPVGGHEPIRIGRSTRIVPLEARTVSDVVRIPAAHAQDAQRMLSGLFESARVGAIKGGRGRGSSPGASIAGKVSAVTPAPSPTLINPSSVHAGVSASPALVSASAAPPFTSSLVMGTGAGPSPEETVRATLKDLTADGRLSLKDRDAPTYVPQGTQTSSSSRAAKSQLMMHNPVGTAHAFSGGGHKAPKPTLHKGMWEVMVHIARTDGPRALIRGLLPRMLMQGPASAATFVAYEKVKRLSRKEEDRE